MIRLSVLLVSLVFSCTAMAAESRLSLTASDGTGLVLTRLKARVVLEGFLAFSELELVFHNPENRRREGRFQMVLPEGAAISRFAMEVGGYLQEGEVVETGLARRAYEDFLHRRQDPALLESDSGNRFNARIFPIEPGEHKRLILSYSQRLMAGDYVLPLAGLPQLTELDIRVYHDVADGQTREVGGFSTTTRRREVLQVAERDFLPAGDFRMPRALLAGQTLRSGDLLAARLVPLSTSDPAPLEDLLLLVDTSASQAPQLADTLARLGELLGTLKPRSVRLLAFDQTVVDLGVASDPAGWQDLLAQLAERPALGASRLDGLLTYLKSLEQLPARVLLVSDMVVTAGETDTALLGEQLGQLDGVQRVDILLPAYHQDRALAGALVRVAPAAGVVAAMGEDLATLRGKLTRGLATELPVTVTGAEWYWPETIPALQADQPVLVFARLSGEALPEIRVAGQLQTLQLQSTEALLLHREAVRGRLDKLLAMEAGSQDTDLKRALHREIIDLSVRERVLSPYTSLLVLETEADYARYGIDRLGLAGILTVGADGLEVTQRAGRQAGEPRQEPQPALAEAPSSPEAMAAPMDELQASGEMALPMAETERVEDDGLSQLAVEESLSADRAPPAELRARVATSEPESFLADRAQEQLAPSSEPGSAPLRMPTPPPVSAAPVERPGLLGRLLNSLGGGAASEPPQAIASPPPPPVDAWSGRYADFQALLVRDPPAALTAAWDWRAAEPADLLALIALGEAAEAVGDTPLAARAYGSLIDYFPGRADIRRWAAERLLALGGELWLAVDSLEKAVADRPDHPSAHLLLALAQWQVGAQAEAVLTLDAALSHDFGRFAEAGRILRETRDLLLSVLAGEGRMAKLFPDRSGGWENQREAGLRFLLVWETDANDVDLHVHDAHDNHAYYQQMSLPSGGRLYADITTGYGPEAFRIDRPAAFPYRLAADYFNRGPMGYGMGAMLVLDYRPDAGLQVDTRPFVVMNDKATVDLGVVSR